jgi:hypothetical protein
MLGWFAQDGRQIGTGWRDVGTGGHVKSTEIALGT